MRRSGPGDTPARRPEDGAPRGAQAAPGPSCSSVRASRTLRPLSCPDPRLAAMSSMRRASGSRARRLARTARSTLSLPRPTARKGGRSPPPEAWLGLIPGGPGRPRFASGSTKSARRRRSRLRPIVPPPPAAPRSARSAQEGTERRAPRFRGACTRLSASASQLLASSCYLGAGTGAFRDRGGRRHQASPRPPPPSPSLPGMRRARAPSASRACARNCRGWAKPAPNCRYSAGHGTRVGCARWCRR